MKTTLQFLTYEKDLLEKVQCISGINTNTLYVFLYSIIIFYCNT